VNKLVGRLNPCFAKPPFRVRAVTLEEFMDLVRRLGG
jgi:hypothetical protein